MRLFACRVCGAALYFENTQCERCGHVLGFDPGRLALTTLVRRGDVWADPAGDWMFCANAAHGVCNWLIPAAGNAAFCLACRHNRTIPDLSEAGNLTGWRTLESAKHRLVYALLRLGLKPASRAERPDGLAFDFLSDSPSGKAVVTGHREGLITIALREADPAERARMGAQMGEFYRTPLGHFRHESGHYFWNVLLRDANDRALLDRFRDAFGDERADYGAALAAHYARPDDGSWRERHVSLYASSHPWEDFAETWAHYLHLIDTLDTASAFGVRVAPEVNMGMATAVDFDPYAERDVERMIAAWLPLCAAMNSLNRAMGLADPYPFVLSSAVVAKLGFVQALMPR